MQDVARVMPLIMDQPMCVDCIAITSRMNPGQVRDALRKVAIVMVLREEHRALCRQCRMKARVVSAQRVRLLRASAGHA